MVTITIVAEGPTASGKSRAVAAMLSSLKAAEFEVIEVPHHQHDHNKQTVQLVIKLK